MPNTVGYLLDAFLFLALFRAILVWVYDWTESLLVAMLMHASLTASARSSLSASQSQRSFSLTRIGPENS